MALTIDQLNIVIDAESKQATAAVDALINRFGRLSNVLNTFNKSGTKVKGNFDKMSTSATKASKGLNTYTQSADKGSKSTQKFSDKLVGQISKFHTLYGAFRMVARTMGNWFNESNDYIETLNLFNVTMGEASEEAYNYAEKVQNLIGIDIAEWMNYQGTFKQLTSGFGVASESADVMSQNLTQLSYDLASFFNKDVEVAFDKLSSAMAGQVKGLREFGIDTTVASLQEYALAKGIDKSVRSMTQAEKSILRYNYIMEKSILIQGDMARTLVTPANAIRILTAQLTQLKRALGNIISVLITGFIPYVQFAVEALTDAANAIATFFGFEIPKIDYSGLDTGDFTEDLEDSEDAVGGVSDTLKKIKKQLMGFDELNIINNPDASGSGSGGDASGGGALNMELLEYDFLKNLDTSKADAIRKQFEDIGKTAVAVAKIIGEALGLEDVWKSIKKGIDAVNFSSIADNAKSVFSSLKPIAVAALEGLGNVLKGDFGYIGTTMGGMIATVGKSIEITMSAISDFFKAEGESISSWIGETTGTISIGMEAAASGMGGVFDSLLSILETKKTEISLTLQETFSTVFNVAMTVGTVFSDLFTGLMQGFSDFTAQESPLIAEFLGGVIESVNLMAESVNTTVGGIFTSLRNWWETDGVSIWNGIVEVFFDLTAKLTEFWNDTIKPTIDKTSTTLTNLWNKHLEPLWQNILSFLKSVWDFTKALWDGILKPIVSFILESVGPPIVNVIGQILDVVSTVIGVVSDVVGGILKALGGLLDFITGLFTGNWKKAWNGIQSFFSGIWSAIWAVVKGVINLVIDGLNSLWRGLYSTLAGIINGVGGLIKDIGSIFGVKWGWEIPSQPPLIPKLAGGGIVDAGQMFIAREAGPELVGSIGKKTAVANNDQIISGIESGVYRAMVAANSNKGGTQTIRIINEIDGDVVGEKVIQYHNGKVMQTGVSPLLV